MSSGSLNHGDDLAARLVVGLEGTWPSAREQAWLGHWRPRGVILFARNIFNGNQLKALCRLLDSLVPGLEIMADHEGGPISHLAGAVGQPPAPWTLGMLDDVDLTRRVHRETGELLKRCGVTRVLAPCADVLTELANPVIGMRAFGGDEALVARHVQAAVKGLKESGMASCLKHWPGHGGSATDSHLDRTSIADTATGPFKRGIQAGADAVMVGHLAGAGGLPATLDHEFLTASRSALEAEKGGPVTLFADDVTMGGLRGSMKQLGVPEPDAAESGLVEPEDLPREWLARLADGGCDRLLIRGIPWRAFPVENVCEAGTAETPRLEDGDDDSVVARSYLEAQNGWRQWVPWDFMRAGSAVGWLDTTADDRWDSIVPGQADAREGLRADLQGRFSAVELMVEGGAGTGAITRLLVTSHRPLSANLISGSGLAKAGRAWVWGHPSLASWAGDVLGDGWEVTYCPEMDWKVFW